MKQQSTAFPNGAPNSEASTSSGPAADEAGLALKGSVVEGAHDLSDKVKNVAGSVATQARSSVEGQLTTRKDRAAEGLGDVAEALRYTGDHLRSQDKTGFTQYIARVADHVDAASGYLQNKSFGQVVGDVERFARREPALFLGGAFVVGLVGGRFLKSSGTPASGPASDSATRSSTDAGRDSAGVGGGEPARTPQSFEATKSTKVSRTPGLDRGEDGKPRGNFDEAKTPRTV